jgi:trehalose 6-phosphate phosphatase
MTARRDALERLAREPSGTGLFSDFDGTLAAIVSDPERAVPLPRAEEAMRQLASLLRRVAIVSGRPASFLARHFAGGGAVSLYGLHGLELWEDGRAEPVEAARPYAAAVAAAVAEARAAGAGELTVEDKGLALTLHWRQALDPASTAAAGVGLASRLAERFGLLAKPGRSSIELVPPTGIDKGSVVAREGAGLAVACFLGDDAGDLAAFEALDRLEHEGASVVRIAVDSAEAPAELLARADLVLDGPGAAAGFLADLVGRLSDKGAPP